jgi:hypothetical protein
LFRDWRAHLQREADRNRRHHCGRSGQTVRRAPTPRASGHPIRLPRGGTEPPALSCCVNPQKLAHELPQSGSKDVVPPLTEENLASRSPLF